MCWETQRCFGFDLSQTAGEQSLQDAGGDKQRCKANHALFGENQKGNKLTSKGVFHM